MKTVYLLLNFSRSQSPERAIVKLQMFLDAGKET